MDRDIVRFGIRAVPMPIKAFRGALSTAVLTKSGTCEPISRLGTEPQDVARKNTARVKAAATNALLISAS